MDLLTTKQIAAELGVSINRLAQLARRRGVKPADTIGTAYLWNPEDIERLRPGKPGNLTGRPRHRKGNPQPTP